MQYVTYLHKVFYTLNKGNSTNLKTQTSEYSGNIHAIPSIAKHGFFGVETFIGSAQVTISQISDKEVMVKVFNITSLTSGDLAKHLPWNNYPTSVVRDPSKAGYATANN